MLSESIRLVDRKSFHFLCLSMLQTPRYWVNKTVPGRVHKTLGSKMKFIVILRDPVDRLHSDYNFNVSEYVLYCGKSSTFMLFVSHYWTFSFLSVIPIHPSNKSANTTLSVSFLVIKWIVCHLMCHLFQICLHIFTKRYISVSLMNILGMFFWKN